MSNPGQGNPGMDPEIFEQFIDQLRRYVRERLIPAEEDVIANDAIPDDILAEMREMGLFGITIPEEFGGAGMNISQYIETVKQLAYAAPAYRSTMSINVGMTGSAIKNFGTAEQKAHWLPRIASGEIACFGLTEPGSGSDSAAMQTFAARDGNGYVLNGTKRYITNSPHAKIGLIMARTSKEALPKNAHVSCFIIDMDNPGISVGKPDKKMGQAGAHIADIIMEDVKIPGDALVGGEEGRGFQIAMQASTMAAFRLPRWASAWGAASSTPQSVTQPSAKPLASLSPISSSSRRCWPIARLSYTPPSV